MEAPARLLVIGTALFTLLSGCGKSGGDYAASVSWAINGMLPTPAICQEQGIARGRLDVRDRRGENAQSLEGDCAATVFVPSPDPSDPNFYEYGGFETSDAFEYDVPYLYDVSLVDASGRAVAPPSTGEMRMSADQGDFYDLPAIDFLQPNGTAAALHAEWRVNVDGAPIDDVAASCQKAGIDVIYILVTTAFDPDFRSGVAFRDVKCSDGAYTSMGRELATGSYFFRYEAVSASGSTVQVGEPIEVDVDGSGDVILPRETFRFAAR